MDLDRFEPRYLVTLDELYHPHWAARKKRRIAFLREAFEEFWPQGHPTQLMQITGTNGKGTVAHYIAEGLRFHGRTGSWTGPHVFDYAERIHIQGEPADHGEIARVYRDVLEPYQQRFTARHAGESLSFAELGILLALHLFQQHGVNWAVMEVGAGGRYTPLMALPMKACILTNIGHDHPKTLGQEPWQRALEKAGIAREGVPFFTADHGETLAFVCAAAKAEGAEVHVLEEHDLTAMPESPEFKQRNLALACMVIRHFFPLHESGLLIEAMTAHLPARFAHLSKNVIADVAHNPDKVTRFAEALRHTYPGRQFHFLIGLTRERDAEIVFAPILPLAKRITVTSASYAGREPKEIAVLLAKKVSPEVTIEVNSDPHDAYQTAIENLPEDDILVLTGSAYMIDQAANPNPYIRHLNATYGWRTNR